MQNKLLMCVYNASHTFQGPRGKPGPKGEKGEHGSNVLGVSLSKLLCVLFIYLFFI